MPSIAIGIVNSLNGFVLVRLIVCHVQLLQQHCHAAAVAMVLVSADVHNCSHHKRSHHKHQGRVYHVWVHFWDLVCNVDVRMVCLATCEISFVHVQFARLLYLFPSSTMYFVRFGISYSHANTEKFRRASLSFSFLRVLDDPHISCISCISCINSINCIPMIPSKARLVRLVPSRCV